MRKIINAFVVCFIGTSCAMNPHDMPNENVLDNVNGHSQRNVSQQQVNAHNQHIGNYMRGRPLRLNVPMVNAMNIHPQYSVYRSPQVQCTAPINVNSSDMIGRQTSNVQNLVLQPRDMQGVNVSAKKVEQKLPKTKEKVKVSKPKKRNAVNKKSRSAPAKASKPRRLELTELNLDEYFILNRDMKLARVKEYIENAEKYKKSGVALYPINLYE